MENNKHSLWYLLIPTLVLVLLIIFIYQNTVIVEVKFLMFDGNIRLINLMIICIILGILASKSFGYYRSFKNRKKTVEIIPKKEQVVVEVVEKKVEPKKDVQENQDDSEEAPTE